MIENKIVTVCINRRGNPDHPSCAARGGVEIADALELAISERGLAVRLERFNCLGQCERGPNVKLSPAGEFLHGVSIADLPILLNTIEKFTNS
jgi:(2Fe-2S) ferredoxin